jgi:hypothetical protein
MLLNCQMGAFSLRARIATIEVLFVCFFPQGLKSLWCFDVVANAISIIHELNLTMNN